MADMRRCGIIGAGSVGAASAYTLAVSGLFSEVVLLDADEQKAEGEAADIAHGAALGRPCRVYAGKYEDFADCGLVILAAGANQRPGETREALLGRNREILRSILEQLTRVNREAILLVVANPVDILTGYALSLSGFPPERVIGSGTVLDTARVKCLLGRRLGVDSRNVHAFMLGEHGDSELAVWSSANISGADLDDYCRIAGITKPADELSRIYEHVRDAAYQIIDSKGATYYGIGMAVRRIAEAIVRDERAVLPVSTLARGAYGIEGVCLGLPAVVGRRGVQGVLALPLSQEEKESLLASAGKLRTLMG